MVVTSNRSYGHLDEMSESNLKSRIGISHWYADEAISEEFVEKNRVIRIE